MNQTSHLPIAPVILPRPNLVIAAQFCLYLPEPGVRYRTPDGRGQSRRVKKANDTHTFYPGRLSQGSEAT
jgi:hypothetical protein